MRIRNVGACFLVAVALQFFAIPAGVLAEGGDDQLAAIEAEIERLQEERRRLLSEARTIEDMIQSLEMHASRLGRGNTVDRQFTITISPEGRPASLFKGPLFSDN